MRSTINKENFKESCEIVKEKITIVEYLEKEGRVHYPIEEYTRMIRCPFPDHDDRTPSFSFDLDKGLFNCFGCGRGGDVVNLHYHFMRLEKGRYNLVRAVTELSRKYRIEIPDIFSKDTEFQTGRVNKYRKRIVEVDNLPLEVYWEKIRGYKRLVKGMKDVKKKATIYRWIDDLYLGLRDEKEVFQLIRSELR